MQTNSVIKSARGRWLAGAAVIAGTILVSACGSSHPTPTTSSSASATPTSSAVAAAPSTAPSTVATPTAPAAPATSEAPANPGGTNAATTTCARMAAHHTYLYVTEAQPATGGALTLVASPAKLICGGPDDSHYDVAKNLVTAHLLPNASIEVFPTTTGQMRDVPIKASQLSSYLKTD
ncbi:MAG TPA: hypothetical protein VH089_22945, partial [Streptosporangiaceae bacterium]|nr:hypothetical protein [Streptosporangiaceae bacterium]